MGLIQSVGKLIYKTSPNSSFCSAYSKFRKFLEILGILVTLSVCVIIVWLGTKYAWQSTKILERSIHQTAFNPQIWWFKWFIPVSAALVFIQAIVNLFKKMYLSAMTYPLMVW